MSNLLDRRAFSLCVLVLCSLGASRAAAQTPPFGGPSQPPPVPGPDYASPNYGEPQFGDSQYGNVPRYSPAPPLTSPLPAYPDTRTASRTGARYGSPDGSPNSGTNHAGTFNAGTGAARALPNTQFNQGVLPFAENDFSTPRNPIVPVGHTTKSFADCDCNDLGRYDPGCLNCSEQACLFPRGLAGFHIGGWVQQGMTANFGDPDDRMNTPVLFNDRANDYTLNQLYLYAERPVQNDGYHWDVGGRVDVMLGSDARFLTVPGLEEHHDGTPKWNGETDRYGLAIPQAYLEFAAPWLHGVSLKMGHFYSIAGYETAPAPQNFFYSHSYTYLYGEPFTHTGALFTAKPNDIVTLNAGYTQGWDVLESNSNEYGILASIRFTSLDRRTSLAATVHSGTDVTGVRVGGALIDEDRHFYSIVLQHQINDCLRYVFQHDFGYQQDGEVVVNIAPRTITFDDAKWYGINQYLIYQFDATTSAALRVEWFRDQDHSRVAVPVKFNPGGTTFLGGNYVAVTGGVNWRPNSNVTIRPEVRWDYSDLKGNGAAPGGNPNVRAFDDSRHSNQITAAVDVIITY